MAGLNGGSVGVGGTVGVDGGGVPVRPGGGVPVVPGGAGVVVVPSGGVALGIGVVRAGGGVPTGVQEPQFDEHILLYVCNSVQLNPSAEYP